MATGQMFPTGIIANSTACGKAALICKALLEDSAAARGVSAASGTSQTANSLDT